MQTIYPQIKELGGDVLVVSFAKPKQVEHYVAKYPLPFPVLADPELRAYRAFELTRATWGEMLRPGVLWRYLKLVVRGWRPWKTQEGDDLLQLGGDFILDRQRRLRAAYPSKEPTERPSAMVLLEKMREAVGSPA